MHEKRYSTLLIIRKCTSKPQWDTTLRSLWWWLFLKHKKWKITRYTQHGEIRTPMHCWRECKMVQPLWKTVWWFLKKSHVELPYDPSIPLLGLYPKEPKAGTPTGVCTFMFITALFTIAKWRKHLALHHPAPFLQRKPPLSSNLPVSSFFPTQRRFFSSSPRNSCFLTCSSFVFSFLLIFWEAKTYRVTTKCPHSQFTHEIVQSLPVFMWGHAINRNGMKPH